LGPGAGDTNPAPRSRPQRASNFLQDRRQRDDLVARSLDARLRARKDEERLGEACQPVSLAIDVPEEDVAFGIVLRTSLQHVDRADDRSQGALQLVCCIGHELTLCSLLTLLDRA